MSPPTAPIDHARIQPVRIRRTGGDIDLQSTPSGAELLTMGGNISIERSNGFVAATTMGGDIVIDTLESGAHLQLNGGSARIYLASRASREPRNLDITVRGGNVRLIFAEPVSATFDIELGYGRNEGEPYSIKSDFPLTETKSGWERHLTHLFQARQQITASGTAGAGVDRIRIRVEGGTIYLSSRP
jgi:DUF4097 and DUF4098 domain-containing protein YvlB